MRGVFRSQIRRRQVDCFNRLDSYTNVYEPPHQTLPRSIALSHGEKSEHAGSRHDTIVARLRKATKHIGYVARLVEYLKQTRNEAIARPDSPSLTPETISLLQTRIDVMTDLESLRRLLDALYSHQG